MPASKLNYIIAYNNHSQIYGSSSKKIAIDSPPPDGLSLEDKNIFFITLDPENGNLNLYKIEEKENNEQEADK